MMLTLRQILPVLMVLVVTEISTLVPPPENITLSCQNFETSVHWSYRGLLPQPGFKVEIFYSASSPRKAETKQPSYDLTPVIWRDRLSPVEVYYLEITAMNGAEESEPSQSPSVTFNRNKMAQVTCQLDFPAVDLSVKGKVITVSFINPFHHYRHLSDSKQEHDVFSYQVHVENQLEPEEYTCRMEERVCRREVLVLEERQQYCLYLTGDIIDNGVSKDKRAVIIPFNRTQTTCVRETETPFLLMVVAVLVMVAFLVVIVVAMVCCAKAWKNTPSTLPKTLVSMLSNPSDRKVLDLSYEKVSQISAIELRTRTTMDDSLLEVSLEEEEEEEEEGPSHTQTNHMGSEVSPHPPIGPGPGEELSESGRGQGRGCTGIVTVEQSSMESDSETLEGVMVVVVEEEEEEEEEETRCPYIQRHVEVEVDMDFGDVVRGYGPV